MDLTDLINSIDIVEFLSQYTELEEKNGEYWSLSPFTNEKTPSFSVRKETNSWFDFSSGLGGNVFTFVRHYFKCSATTAVHMLEKYVGCEDGITTRHDKLSATVECRKYLAKKAQVKQVSTTILPDDYMERYEDRPEKLDIWRNEGISDEAMTYFGVKYDSFSNCIVYPIKNESGQIVNVGGRTLEPNYKERGIRKYTYFKPWGGQMAIVYGLFENMDAILEKKEVILFEGMKSVLLARGYGYKNCGALLTSHISASQMKVLAKLGVRVVIATDKDVDPLKDHNLNRLKHYVNCEYLCDHDGLLDEKDSPVDKGKEVFDKLYGNRQRIK